MNYHKITTSDIDFFIKILGDEHVILEHESLEKFAHDETEDYVFFPEVVLKPTTTQEVSDIVKYCNNKLIPITPRGAGTGLSGGSLCIFGGVSLSLERMNRILKVDTQNAQVITEPGVITEVLQMEVERYGLYYPPDPASKGSCFIGGNVAENSGGPRAVKYGVVKDFILNLEVVLPNGEVIMTGANVLKNATGYNLTQLMIGSEGTLGIITKIVARLIPKPKFDISILVPFKFLHESCQAVSELYKYGCVPSACELMEKDALNIARQYLGITEQISNDIQAHLLIEVDGMTEESCLQQIEDIVIVLEKYAIGEILFADDSLKKESIWKTRRNIGHAVKSHSAYKELDSVMPRSSMAEMVEFVKKLEIKYGFLSFCYGHAGDGNIHINIVKNSLNESEWTEKIPMAVDDIFRKVVSMNGTISGEHGIGMLHKNNMHIPFSETALMIQKNIKNVFDPNQIMNPGKVIA